MVITFDENGGTYDHMPPWDAVPTGREPEVVQFGFELDCYGVRVPTLLISKHIKPGTIVRSPTAVPFDHTSIIATILEWQQIPKGEWNLGDRVDQAPTFDEVLEGADDADTRRTEATGISERYLPEKLKTGTMAYDPYQRLTVDPEGSDSTAVRYLRWRAGEWDLWRMQPRSGV